MTNKMKQSVKMDTIPFSGIRKVFEAAGKLELEGKEIINLGIGRPNFDTPEFIKDAAKKAIDDGYTYYTSNYGIEPLREAIAKKFNKDNGLHMEISDIIVAVGAADQSFFQHRFPKVGALCDLLADK